MTRRKILLATDRSANSALAAKWASNYAALADVDVVLAHVIEMSIPNWLRNKYAALENEEPRQKLKDELLAWYQHHTGHQASDVLLAGGSPDLQLVEMVQDTGATMLVIAKSGKSGLSKLLAGSTAQMMVANPPCPVAVVHPDHTELTETSRIAVATDLTESSEIAITAAAVLSSAMKSHLDIVHASNFSSSDEATPEGLSADELRQATDKQMNTILSNHSDELEDTNFHSHIINAGPVDALTQFAEQENLDVVFVGNAASYNVVTNIFGRVSVKLTQMLQCTVVVVPPNTEIPAP